MSALSKDAVAALRDALESLRDAALPAGDGRPNFLRAVAQVGDINLLDWLAACAASQRLYWENRDATAAVAGIGSADTISGSPSDCSHRFLQLYGHTREIDPETRYYGGMGFFKTVTEPQWQPFNDCTFMLPRFELKRDHGRTALACNLIVQAACERDAAVDQAINELPCLSGSGEQPISLPRISGSRRVPDRAQWCRQVDSILAVIAQGAVDKVVLAGTERYTFAGPVDPVTVMRRLARRSPDCVHFMIQLDAAHAFVGATPERLYSRRGRHLESEAIAGTRPRGGTETDDQRLAADLLSSEKDCREHQHVLKTLLDSLAPLTTSLSHETTAAVLKLDCVQHLHQAIHGELEPQVMDDDIIRALHPSAAVGGVPKLAALKVIATTEQTDRGWYASPIGWLSRDAAEFAVAIRSGLIADSELVLYAGAGIVHGSEAESEWDEIGHKLESFAQVVHDEC